MDETQELMPMMATSTSEGTRDVPARVFERFLQSLEQSGESVELVGRLRKTLLEDKTFTDRALKEAILAEESPL
jgi:hypothetical protein